LTETPRAKGVILGVACEVGAAAFWAAGFVAARHGIAAGLSPFDIAFHRFVWAGLFFLPGVLRRGIGRLNGIGWRRGLLLAMLGGPFQAIIVSASGFLLVPLAHGGVVQPSVMVLTGLLLATLILRERQPPGRIYGAAMIIAGIAVIGGEAVTSTGGSGVLGDAAFALAGALFAAFGTLLRLWHVTPARATAVIGALALLYVPLHATVFGFGRMIAAGWFENALQLVPKACFPDRGQSICSPGRWRSWGHRAPPCFRRWCPASPC
jgi:drug/metabolite transporter (DMT)-like permease